MKIKQLLVFVLMLTIATSACFIQAANASQGAGSGSGNHGVQLDISVNDGAISFGEFSTPTFFETAPTSSVTISASGASWDEGWSFAASGALTTPDDISFDQGRRTNVDAYYSLATTATTVAAGWDNGDVETWVLYSSADAGKITNFYTPVSISGQLTSGTGGFTPSTGPSGTTVVLLGTAVATIDVVTWSNPQYSYTTIDVYVALYSVDSTKYLYVHSSAAMGDASAQPLDHSADPAWIGGNWMSTNGNPYVLTNPTEVGTMGGTDTFNLDFGWEVPYEKTGYTAHALYMGIIIPSRYPGAGNLGYTLTITGAQAET